MRILIMSVCQLVYKYLAYFYIGKLLLVINMSPHVLGGPWFAESWLRHVPYRAVIGRDAAGSAGTGRWLVEVASQLSRAGTGTGLDYSSAARVDYTEPL